ncbi:hypothetical protein [Bdellovibrio svalbardensis]|uniref:Uncharacterized protein n=1 Tax=Bdellovibrio svalbardensis TaxID=2972972 RepID=A0ABT6DHS4_9BACT|nr:hypothetical protein [Bdellovibrio svalbardensis]MDG0815401.1 hypothetical protein [Bdellovibrio svalbardensis]
MKTFTYTQKKWAMASALLLVLGFNVSFNTHTGGIAAMDLASEAGDVIPSKITTSKGVANVKYIKTGDKEVLALVPKVTEGKGYCEDCGFTQYTLNVAFDKNTKDIDSLNVALMAKIEEDKAEKVVAAPAKEKEEVAPEAEVKKVKAKLTFTEKVLKKCGADKDDAEAVDCRLTEISSVLADEKVDQKEVATFYGKYVQQSLAKAIASDDQNENQTALDQLTALQDNLITEKGWKELRQRMGLTLAASIGYAGNTVKTFYTNYQTAINTNDLNASSYWMNMYQQGQNNVFAAKNNFANIQTTWANNSLREQSISYADLNNIVWSYSNPADQIFNQLVSSPQNYNFVNGQLLTSAPVNPANPGIPGTISNPGTVIIQQPDGSLLAPRLAPGRGVGVINGNQVVVPTLVPSSSVPATTSPGVQYIAVPASLSERVGAIRAQ